ncbi:GNAT family N-acetyltransferase [Embleya scabrispora]|uniref:GNAT family N-acetyltransferase n=1 Tax=Embleya scabrispora TaxID=159449 RepID=UPI00037DC889|nr:GNAT family N-acetyltransferase [Embleya scabrispora]MYS81984.1 GNAT family N-acetyltransferase [Streptomyces sp. SID5474]
MTTVVREHHPFSAAELIRAWVTGWAPAREVPPPVEVAGGFRLRVGLPGHRVRYVLFDIDRVAELARTRTAPGTWIKVLAPVERVRAELTSAWTVGVPEYAMSGPLRRATASAPSGYTIEVESMDEVVLVRVRATDGAVAAQGRIAVTGETAVADRIGTDAAHRRRGLGSVVMTTLGDAAAARGARTGVLVASADGLALYSTLGWTRHGVLTAAWIPEPESESASVPAQPRPAR